MVQKGHRQTSTKISMGLIMKIHLLDMVTCDSYLNGKRLDSFYKIIGIRKIDEFENYEGLWDIQDIVDNKTYQALGNSLTVWRPVNE